MLQENCDTSCGPLNYITQKICHTLLKFTACFLDALPRRLSLLMMYIRRCVLPKCKLYYELIRYIYTGALCCIVKLPDEACVSHTKSVGEIKKLHNYSSQSAAR